MLLFADGADHLADGQELKKWTSGGVERTTSLQRTGVAAWTNASNGGQSMQYYLSADEDTLIMGCAARLSVTSNHQIFSFMDGNTHQIQVWYMQSTGRLRVYRGNASSIIADGTTVIPSDAYFYVEMKATINNSGTYEVRLNEIVEISGSADTQESSNAYTNRIQIFGNSNSPLYIDDIYLLNDTNSGVSGAPNNDFLGDIGVDTLWPNGNGNSSQFTGQDSDSTDNYLNVDETTPDDDTTYNESGTVGNKDTYAYQNMTFTSGDVFGVQIVPYARKTAAGARSMKSIARLSGVESDGPAKALSDTYLCYPDVREADPGGSQWTIANVNAAEFGAKVYS